MTDAYIQWYVKSAFTCKHTTDTWTDVGHDEAVPGDNIPAPSLMYST